jgi:hypothetical protein
MGDSDLGETVCAGLEGACGSLAEEDARPGGSDGRPAAARRFARAAAGLLLRGLGLWFQGAPLAAVASSCDGEASILLETLGLRRARAVNVKSIVVRLRENCKSVNEKRKGCEWVEEKRKSRKEHSHIEKLVARHIVHPKGEPDKCSQKKARQDTGERENTEKNSRHFGQALVVNAAVNQLLPN